MTDHDDKIQSHKPSEDENSVLWQKVVADVKPLDKKQKNKRELKKVLSEGGQKPEIKKTALQKKQELMPPNPTQSAKVSGGNELDRRTAEKLRKGKMPIDGKLDLHGLTQIQAYDALCPFILNAYARGARCLLVITGKGKSTEGVLRRKTPEWLKEEPFDRIVLKIQEARPEHGGAGALYVFLRRKREN